MREGQDLDRKRKRHEDAAIRQGDKLIIEWKSPKYTQRTESEHAGLTGVLGLFSIMEKKTV